MSRKFLRHVLTKPSSALRNRRYSSAFQEGPDQIVPAEDYRAWNPSDAVKLRLQPTGPQSTPPISVPSLLKIQVENLPNNLALRSRGPTGDNIDWTWSDYYEDVFAVSKGFLALGLEPFHTVAIIGHNDPVWNIATLAAIHGGGFGTGIYQTNTPSACKHIAQDSRANIIVVGDRDQLDKILSIRSELPHLRAIVQYGDDPVTEPGVLSWQQLKEVGREQGGEELGERLRNIAVNRCCMLTYTSGTTGNPKGTMLSHDSVTHTAEENCNHFGWEYGKETTMSYLPMSHIAGVMMDIYLPLSKGAVTYFADKNALKGSLIANYKYFKPARMVGVPRVWEKIEEGLKLEGAKTTGLKKYIGDWAKRQALSHHEKEMGGVPHSSLGYSLAKKLVLSKVHQALGFENMVPHGALIGASAVSPDTVRYFLSLDFKLLEIITSTESCGTMQITNKVQPGNFRVGKVGRAYNDVMEVKLDSADQSGVGELLCRGRGNFMGYLNNEEKTLETLDDEGWLHTGDLLQGGSDGFYKVVGRIKEIIITSGGENVAPTNIEGEIKTQLAGVFSNVMVVGDQRKYLTCLLTLKVQMDPLTMSPTNKLDPQTVAWIKSVGGGEPSTTNELLESPDWAKVEAAIQAGMERANQNAISNVARVKKWIVLPRDFSVDGGELSPSLKLKRFHVAELYKEEIDRMYQGDE